ncbi:MAG: hypothetical protein QOH19_594 [Actinomycetota bacterium]|nr:hypothetical protein [Actinomycetota bacterium]
MSCSARGLNFRTFCPRCRGRADKDPVRWDSWDRPSIVPLLDLRLLGLPGLAPVRAGLLGHKEIVSPGDERTGPGLPAVLPLLAGFRGPG